MRRQRSEVAPSGAGWLRDPWLVHLLMVGGFVGLAFATLLDFVFLYLLAGVLHLAVFWPARILGTASGLALLAGVSLAIVRRLRRDGPSAAHTRTGDVWLLALLFLLACTGFWIEVVVTFPIHTPINDWILLIHSVMAMEVVFLLGATKLAHALYRPLALLFMHRRCDVATDGPPA